MRGFQTPGVEWRKPFDAAMEVIMRIIRFFVRAAVRGSFLCAVLVVTGCGGSSAPAASALKAGEEKLAAKDMPAARAEFEKAIRSGGLASADAKRADRGMFETYVAEVKGDYLFIGMGIQEFDAHLDNPSDAVLVDARSSVPPMKMIVAKLEALDVEPADYAALHRDLVEAAKGILAVQQKVIAIDAAGGRDLKPAADLCVKAADALNRTSAALEAKAKAHGLEFAKMLEL